MMEEILEEKIKRHQNGWDKVFQKNRLALVTCISTDFIEKLENLKLFHAAYRKNKYMEMYFKSNSGIIVMGCNFELFSSKNVYIARLNEELLMELIGEIVHFPFQNKREYIIIKSFLNELLVYVTPAANEIIGFHRKRAEKTFKEEFMGKKITDIHFSVYGEPFFVLEDGKELSGQNFFYELCKKQDEEILKEQEQEIEQ